MGALENNLEKMQKRGVDKIHQLQFENYFNQVKKGYTSFIDEKDIEALKDIDKFEDLEENFDNSNLANHLAAIKLNGGLGTTMGLEKAKSLLKINDEDTILDKILIANKDYTTVFMDSFRTHSDTIEYIQNKSAYKNNRIDYFIQSVEPKIKSQNLEPVKYLENIELEWCPIGHGDVYTSLFTTKMLNKLIEGYKVKYLFISNSDNLGAIPSIRILKWFIDNKLDFAIELCKKSKQDIKGGHIVKRDGKYILREVSQIRESDKIRALDPEIHPYFNTNNIWVNLESLKIKLENMNGDLQLPLIVNKKRVNPIDQNSEEVYQLETAMGSAVEKFENVKFIEVPRTRFKPIKSNEDLERVRNNI